MVDEELELKKQVFLKNLQMSESEIKKFERNTVNNRKNHFKEIWGKHLAASNFGRVCLLSPTACKIQTLKKCLPKVKKSIPVEDAKNDL